MKINFSVTNSAVEAYKQKVIPDEKRMDSDKRIRAIIICSCRASSTYSKLEQLGIDESLEADIELIDERRRHSFGRYRLRIIKEKKINPQGGNKGPYIAVTRLYST